MSTDTKALILATVDDAVSDLMYYGRKGDEELPPGAIQLALDDGIVTVAEMVAQFEKAIRAAL